MNHLFYFAAAMSSDPALASHPDAALKVDNDTGRRVEVIVNGHPFGTVNAWAEMVFPLKSGIDVVTVRDANDPRAAPLLERTLHVRPGQTAEIRVVPPTATLLVTNRGRVPLKVTVGDQGGWIAPGSAMQLEVRPGPTDVTAETMSRYGTWVVDHERLLAVPGRVTPVSVDDARLALLGGGPSGHTPVRWSPRDGYAYHHLAHPPATSCRGGAHGHDPYRYD